MIKRFCFAALALPLLVTAVSAAETEVTLDRNGTLRGTLLSPGSGPAAPAALIIAGSGPTDRNGNSPLGVQANSYALLAQALAAQGITTLRFDKRGIAASAAAMVAESDLRIQTYSDDAKAWAESLHADAHTDCVWLIGHSEGALLAEMVAQDNPHVCGVALVSGAGRKAGDLLRDQLAHALPDALKQPALDGIARLEQGQTVDNPPPALMSLFRPSVQPYMISWLALDPAALIAKLRQPVLILQGDNDIQIAVDDARKLTAARPNARLVILPGVNHVLKIAPADRPGNLATYANPALPLAPGIADAIAGFMKEHK
ncbi:MAG: alpha/beta hydrolase [Alphaproteobacteria bacterium]|nr:alpha/beta hydrolase [Alphaproteobacteria bacterium]MBL6939594.1 alpha/beta hydrolase [Alphaproteobacteria bacterium]MBL7100033.1 alpha/beta hydrolase [Alphaproteobacteria bacterium]